MYCGRAISDQNSDIHEAGNSACSGTVLFRLYFGEEGPRQVFMIRNKASFYSAELSTPPNPQHGDHPLSAVRDCLFNIFAATIHI